MDSINNDKYIEEYMPVIRLIEKDTDLSKLHITFFDWDLVIHDIPYQVVRIYGFVHTLTGLTNAANDFWAYPLDEKMSYNNLIELTDIKHLGATWTIEDKSHFYKRTKWDETEVYYTPSFHIMRNGKLFYKTHSYEDAKCKIERINDHPIPFNLRGFQKEMENSKIYWRSEPAVIRKFIGGSDARLIIEPAPGIAAFTKPAEFEDDDFEEEDNYIVTTIFDPHIYWFRDKFTEEEKVMEPTEDPDD